MPSSRLGHQTLAGATYSGKSFREDVSMANSDSTPPKSGNTQLIRIVSWDDLKRLGIDARNNLYWDGKPIVTRQHVRLAWFPGTMAFIAAMSTAIIAVVTVAEFFDVSF